LNFKARKSDRISALLPQSRLRRSPSHCRDWDIQADILPSVSLFYSLCGDGPVAKDQVNFFKRAFVAMGICKSNHFPHFVFWGTESHENKKLIVKQKKTCF
jgi:hypothetical protein